MCIDLGSCSLLNFGALFLNKSVSSAVRHHQLLLPAITCILMNSQTCIVIIYFVICFDHSGGVLYFSGMSA